MTRLLIEQPFYGYVAASVIPVESDKVETTKMATIPHLKIFYNPGWYDNLNTNQKIGVLKHELLHVILLHHIRRENREIAWWSVACDMVVNEYIPANQLPDASITVKIVSRLIKRDILRKQSAETYYDILKKADNMIHLTGDDKDSILVSAGNQLLEANRLSDEPGLHTDVNTLKTNLMQTIEDARSQGEVPSDLDNILDQAYQGLRVNWRNILKRFLTGKGKIVVRKSYKRQSRRFENLPGTKRSIGVTALLAIDESGSISNELVNQFYKELKNINKITSASIQVTRFDTACSEPVMLDKFLINKKREKRGGTDFRPVFDLADKLKMQLLIIFTDGDGIAPDAAHQRTLWVLAKNGRKPADFGYCVTFDQ